MKYRTIIIVLFFLLFLPVIGYGDDAVDIIYIEGKAPVTIDGDLSDWEEFSSAPFQLQVKSLFSTVESDEGLSVVMHCFADADYVYVAVKVNDEEIIFDDEIFYHMCDTVIVYFCTENASYSNLTPYQSPYTSLGYPFPSFPVSSVSIRISSDTSGKTIPVIYHGHSEFPYLSEALGIQSALKRGVDGYTVETAIPKRLLSIAVSGGDLLSKMYVVVNDSYYRQLYNRFLRSDTKGLESLNISYPEDKVSAQELSLAEEKKGLEEGLISPEQVSTQDIMYAVFQDVSNRDWVTAEKKLTSLDETLRVNPILAWIQSVSKNYDAALHTFSQVAEESPDKYVRFWAKEHLANIYMFSKKDDNSARKVNKELLSSSNPYLYGEALYRLVRIEMNNFDYEAAVTVFDEAIKKRPLYTYSLERIAYTFQRYGKYEKAIEIHENAISSAANLSPEIQKNIIERSLMSIAYINIRRGEKTMALTRLREILDRYPGLPLSLRLAESFEEAGGYDEALEIYQNIKQSGEETNNNLNARIGIARIHYFRGDYDSALRLSGELINMDSEIDLEARTIVFLIQRKKIIQKIYFALFIAIILTAVWFSFKKYRNVRTLQKRYVEV